MKEYFLMKALKRLLSPRSETGPIFWSVLAHSVIAISVLGALHLRGTEAPTEQNFVDLGYETFDAPPAPAEEVKKVMKSPEPVVQPEAKAVVDSSAKELHDEASEVAGTQVAKKEENIGSESNGTSATTPFYKIKPKYPKAALVAGTEGWVLLEIDILESGEVDNIRVVGGEQRNLFQSEAKRAVAQWKYRPFVNESGQIYKKIDHQVRVDFKLDEAAAEGDKAKL